MRIELLGPATHIPFTQIMPAMARVKSEPQTQASAVGSRKAVDITTPKLNLANIELKSNAYADSIIGESLSSGGNSATNKGESKGVLAELGKKSVSSGSVAAASEFKTPTSKGTVSTPKI